MVLTYRESSCLFTALFLRIAMAMKAAGFAVLVLSLHHGLKVTAEMLDMPLYLVTTWELQIRKILFVPF